MARFAAGRARALGLPTRGTTNPNRLRRVDRWLVGVHALLTELDRCWELAAQPFGPRARWAETAALLADRGWPVHGADSPAGHRWRAGELTVDWDAVKTNTS